MNEIEVGFMFYNSSRSFYGKVTKITKTKIHYNWYDTFKVEIISCEVSRKKFYMYLYNSWERVTPVEQELF